MTTSAKKLKIYLRALVFVVGSLIASLPTYALTAEQIDTFSQNNIIFYDPDDTGNECFVGNGTVSIQGSTSAEKIWSGLRSLGFTEEQAAGAMGNMTHEGNGFNPAQHEGSQFHKYWQTSESAIRNADGTFNLGANGDSDTIPSQGKYRIAYGLGLIQWSFGRRVNLYNYVSQNDPGLLQYFNNPNEYSYANGSVYGMNGDSFIEKVGDSVANAMYAWQLQFLWEEMNGNNDYREVFDQSTVENAAWIFLTHVERPKGITVSTSLADAKATRPERFRDAQAYYDQFAGTTITGGGGDSGISAQDGSDVTIIGDSLADGSRAQILGKFTAMTDEQINAEKARQFSVGIDILKNTELKNTVIFALGTNSAGLTQDQIDEVLTTVGSSRKLVFLTNYGEYDYASNNELFRQAAQANSNVVIADWAGSVAVDPGRFIGADGVHPTADGQQLFADLIYDAINKNVVSNGCSPGGDLTSTVLAYAWPEYHAPKFLEKMPAYADAVTRQSAEGQYIGGHSGVDCGAFVTILMQDSGFEPLYNTGPDGTGFAGNTGPQEDWVQSHGWTLLNSSPNTVVDTGILQHGDVAFWTTSSGGGHTFVYVGEIPGFNSVIASASLGDRAPMAGRENLDYTSKSSGNPIRWYRKGS